MAKLVFKESGDEFELPEGSPIQEICEEQGVPFACTEGICGTCVIAPKAKTPDGRLSDPTVQEEDFLGKGTTQERLGCQCKLMSGTIEISF